GAWVKCRVFKSVAERRHAFLQEIACIKAHFLPHIRAAVHDQHQFRQFQRMHALQRVVPLCGAGEVGKLADIVFAASAFCASLPLSAKTVSMRANSAAIAGASSCGSAVVLSPASSRAL